MSSKIKLFIDTNVYLDFYRTKDVLPLLQPLVDESDNILITKQIVDEIYRNKAKLATNILSDDLRNYQLNIKLPTVLTEHAISELDESFNEKINDAKKAVKEVNIKIKDIKNLLKRIYGKTVEHVSEGKDKVSVELEKIFKNAIPHNFSQLEAARRRKELGNPPGKNTDPIGDELNWEQILDYAEKEKCSIWIISKDGDFITKSVNGIVFGNPFLLREVRERTLSAFQFFENLPSALLKFKDVVNPSLVLPDEKQLKIALEAQITQSEMNECKHEHIASRPNGIYDIYYCSDCNKTLGIYYSDAYD